MIMRKVKTIIMLSMMCVLFEGCQLGSVAFGTVTPTSYRPVSYAGDDSDTTFTFDFEIISTSDLRVWERTDSTGGQTLKTETTHYAVTATNNDFTSGGTVTMVTAPATGVTLTIGRVIPYDQPADFTDADVLNLASITNALDQTILKVQQLEEMLNRAGLNPETDDATLDMTLPNSVDRASQFYGFNGSGEPTVISSGITAGSPTVTAYAETYLDDASEAAFKATTNLESGVDVQGWDAQLDDIAALAVTNGNVIVGDGSNWVAETGATARASLGLTIGTDVQAEDAGLTSIAGLTTAADKMPYTTASDTYAVTALTSFARTLLDDSDAATARTTLGVTDGEYIKLVDSKANTTTGGGATAGSWLKRTVTEETDTGNNVSVSSSVIVLAAGTYTCTISAPAYQCNTHQTRLRNTTGGTTILMGTSERSGATSGVVSRSFIVGRFTIAASQNVEIQHRVGTTQATDGFGQAGSFGETEIYTIAEFWKE
jgi:hypothetical protein